MADLGPPEEPSRSFISRWLSRAGRYASRPSHQHRWVRRAALEDN